jgi:hypothetical protein
MPEPAQLNVVFFRETTYILLLPPTTNTCLYMDVSRHILVSRYIHVKTGISGRRE